MVMMTDDMEVDDVLPTVDTTKPEDEEKEEGVGQLEDAAQKRREKLKALRQKVVGGPVQDKLERRINVPLPKPMFRSYNPSDEKLQGASVPKARPIDIETQVADTLEQGEIKTLVEDVDLTSLAPRKPDWDLKRDVAPKLARLEKRTQRAIAELILERLKNTQEDLAAAVGFLDDPKIRNSEDIDD